MTERQLPLSLSALCHGMETSRPESRLNGRDDRVVRVRGRMNTAVMRTERRLRCGVRESREVLREAQAGSGRGAETCRLVASSAHQPLSHSESLSSVYPPSCSITCAVPSDSSQHRTSTRLTAFLALRLHSSSLLLLPAWSEQDSVPASA